MDKNQLGACPDGAQLVWEDVLGMISSVGIDDSDNGYLTFTVDADNIADLHGINSVLYQDIAYRIFEVQHTGVFFCTDIAGSSELKSEKHTPKFPKDEM